MAPRHGHDTGHARDSGIFLIFCNFYFLSRQNPYTHFMTQYTMVSIHFASTTALLLSFFLACPHLTCLSCHCFEVEIEQQPCLVMSSLEHLFSHFLSAALDGSDPNLISICSALLAFPHGFCSYPCKLSSFHFWILDCFVSASMYLFHLASGTQEKWRASVSVIVSVNDLAGRRTEKN